jgi:carbon starvation protein CstA
MNKKGQLFEQFSGIAIGLAAVTLILVVVFLIAAGTKDNVRGLITPTTYDYATVSLPNGTNTTFTNCLVEEDLVVVAMYNGSTATDRTLLKATNYTIYKNKIELVPNYVNVSNNKNLSYSCKNLEYAYNSTGTLQNATASLPGWIPIVIIIIIGSVLIGLVQLFRR